MRMLLVISLLFGVGCSGDKPKQTFTPLNIPLPDEALNALRNGTDFTLYSLDPALLDAADDPSRFHNFRVLGTMKPSDSERKDLVDALATGATESVGAIAACFDPRHGIRVTHTETTYEFVICFDCLQINWYAGNDARPGVLTSESPAPVFNGVLSRASVRLPEPP